MNINCSAIPCVIILNATCVFYEGPNLIYSGIQTNDNLEEVIQKYDVLIHSGLGTSGTSSTSGSSGSSSSSGTSGINGSSGSSGTSGVGTNGSSGTSGIDGILGSSGTSGSSGINGENGTNGSSGSSATSGTSGINGSSGSSGTSGNNGTSGTSSTSGSSGSSIPSGTYVPYIGATGAVNLGAYDLTVNGLTVGNWNGNVYNTVVGIGGSVRDLIGQGSTAIGKDALYGSLGNYNTAVGYNGLSHNTTGYNNVGIGYDALYWNSIGAFNVALGAQAGLYIDDGNTNNTKSDSSIFIGYNSMAKAVGDGNEIVIGSGAVGNGSNTATWGNTSITDHYFTGVIHTTLGLTTPAAIVSTLATGTAPFTIASTTLNTNLNADLLDGQHGSYYQTVLTNPITGTGVSGQVAFWDSTSTQTGDNELFWDNTNKRLGIGTTSPGNKLTVRNSRYDGIVIENGTYAVASLTGNGLGGDNGNLFLGNGGVAGVSLNASGTSYLNGGNVGIGTTTIPSMLTVAGLINMKNYTVGTLPAGTRGDICYVIDALAPTFLATVVGGGTVVTPVFFDGVTWKGF